MNLWGMESAECGWSHSLAHGLFAALPDALYALGNIELLSKEMQLYSDGNSDKIHLVTKQFNAIIDRLSVCFFCLFSLYT
jgi:hypothetical protein